MFDQQTELAILELEQRRQRALVDVDIDILRDLFDDDLLHVHSTGLVHTKPELLEHIARKRGFYAIQRGTLTLRGNDDMAILTGPIINQIRTADGKEEHMRGFVTQVLRRTLSGWKFLNFQLTVVRD